MMVVGTRALVGIPRATASAAMATPAATMVPAAGTYTSVVSPVMSKTSTTLWATATPSPSTSAITAAWRPLARLESGAPLRPSVTLATRAPPGSRG